MLDVTKSRDTFVGRARELSVLQERYASQASELLTVYGRRRVGKSALVRRFQEDKPGLAYVGKRLAGPVQIQHFLRELGRVVDDPLLGSVVVGSSWLDVLRSTVDRLSGDGKRKVVLSLDELPWIVEGSPELPSVLQECWDRYWKPRGNVLLILCGSALGFLGSGMFGGRDPLLGRRTAQVQLKPFGYREAALFQKAYLIHLFQDMIEHGVDFGHADTPGNYREIDTQQDMDLAQTLWKP